MAGGVQIDSLLLSLLLTLALPMIPCKVETTHDPGLKQLKQNQTMMENETSGQESLVTEKEISNHTFTTEEDLEAELKEFDREFLDNINQVVLKILAEAEDNYYADDKEDYWGEEDYLQEEEDYLDEEYYLDEEDYLEKELKEIHGETNESRTSWKVPANVERNSRGAGSSLKNMWKKMRGKAVTGNWDLSLEEASKLFDDYNECVMKRYQKALDLENGKLKPVHAIMVLEGERVTMKCSVCSRPDMDKAAQQARWMHISRSDSKVTPLTSGKRVTISTQGPVTIKEVRAEDAGQYTCLDRDQEYVAIYQLDAKIKERRKMVKEGEPLLNVTYLEDHNLQLVTSWAAWGPCDACDVIGTQQRHGTCTVKKMYTADPVKPRDFPMLPLYPQGIPCHSTALPFRIRRLKEVRNRYEETIVKECNVSCPTEAPPVFVTDKDGNPVETIPSGKLYGLDEKPVLPARVKRRVLYEPEGKHLILQCSDVERGAGVRWMRGSRRVDPLSIKRQTAGRVWVDSANRFHIAMLLLSDTAVYNCWERQRHVVAIKVLVMDGFNEKIKDYITYSGFAITIIATVIACVVLVGGKKKGK